MIARLMVSEFGMSRLEPMSVKLTESVQAQTKVGTQLSNDIDNEWRRILDECYSKAKEIILQNERRVERIAEALLAEQTILAERLLELWGEDEKSEEVGDIRCQLDAG